MTRYAEKHCLVCAAAFTPTSGRQRYCAHHREPKFRTERNTEARAAQRARTEITAEEATKPPSSLAILGKLHRRERNEWVARALQLARRFHREHQLGISQEIAKWAVRTAAAVPTRPHVREEGRFGDCPGECYGVFGCHHLGSVVDLIEFDLEMRELARQDAVHKPAGQRTDNLTPLSAMAPLGNHTREAIADNFARTFSLVNAMLISPKCPISGGGHSLSVNR